VKGYSSAQSKSDDSVVSRGITIVQYQRGEVFLVSCVTEFSLEALGLGFNSMMGRFLVPQLRTGEVLGGRPLVNHDIPDPIRLPFYRDR